MYEAILAIWYRYYFNEEFDERLPKIYEFYDKYSKVFPNYVSLPENKFMFKNIERKQKFIDDKQRAIEDIARAKDKKNKHHFSDLLAESTEHMFSTKFMDSIIKQDEELNEIRKKQVVNDELVKAVEDFEQNNDSVMDVVNHSNITAEISMSQMSEKENSDLSCIKSHSTQSQHEISSHELDGIKIPNSEERGKNEKRKINVFEYNNLASNNKKMRLINLSKPLQRTDIIQLENSLDFDKSTPAMKKPEKNSVMMSQKFLKENNLPLQKFSKKVSLKSLKMSEHDDRKTFISSTDRQMDTTSNRSRKNGSKQPFKVKRINKKFEYNQPPNQKVSNTPEKAAPKLPEHNIIITKRSEGQRILNKRKKIVVEPKAITKVPDAKDRFISHERKISAVWGNQITAPVPLYMSKQSTNSMSTPLMVCNGVNAVHRHHKSKDAFLTNDKNFDNLGKVQNSSSGFNKNLLDDGRR